MAVSKRDSLPRVARLRNDAHRLYSAATGMNLMTKPEKTLFHNATLMHSLASRVDSGTERETYIQKQ